MYKIKMLFLASALSLGTTAVFSQSKMGAIPDKNATGTANMGSGGTATSPANVNSNPAVNAGSPRASSGAKVGTSTEKKANATGTANTGSSGTGSGPANVNSNAAVNAGSPRASAGANMKMGASGKLAKKTSRGNAAYARAMSGEAAYSRSLRTDSSTVIVNNRVIGRDPDVRIRFELRRDDPARRG